MFPTVVSLGRSRSRLPHAGGGVSHFFLIHHVSLLSSPRRWGCFLKVLKEIGRAFVFPTQVGVFLQRCFVLLVACCLPHAGGGVSCGVVINKSVTASSPRRWGCFPPVNSTTLMKTVFPTQVGVFLNGGKEGLSDSRLPHAGGGVSDDIDHLLLSKSSSPRRWGCFRTSRDVSIRTGVFPTQVGVFLSYSLSKTNQARLPHAGGGVSQDNMVLRIDNWSSPRRWGCFRKAVNSQHRIRVFPTQVGVFLLVPSSTNTSPGLPHAGGGVSKGQTGS